MKLIQAPLFPIFAMLIIFICACEPSKEAVTGAVVERIVVPEEVQKSENYGMKGLFSDLELIPLEVTDASLLPQTGKVLMDEYIYYLGGIKTVYIFDRQGKFVKSLPTGDGPGELGQALDIQLAQNGDLLVLEYLSLFRFSPDGQFIATYDLTQEGKSFLNPRNFAWFAEDNYLFWESGHPGLTKVQGQDFYHLHHIKGDTVYNALKIFSITSGGNRMIQSGDKYYVSPSNYTNEIFEYTERGGLKERYFIDFGSNNVDTTQLQGGFSREAGYATLQKSLEFSSGIMSFMEFGDYLYFEFIGNSKYQYVFYDKGTKAIFNANSNNNLIEGQLPFRIIGHDRKENKVLAILTPDAWFAFMENEEIALGETVLLGKEDIALLSSIDEESNPLLIRLSLK